MEIKNREIVKDSLTKLCKAHSFYDKASNSTQLLLTKQCEFLFRRLEENGVPRHFSETLLSFGKEFLEFELKEILEEDEKLYRLTCEVFGVDQSQMVVVAKRDQVVNPVVKSPEPVVKPVQQTFGGVNDDIPF